MEEAPDHRPAYIFTGPDENGAVRLEMPSLDPKHGGEFFCVTFGTDKDAIAKAMCLWPCENGYGEME
ncbi:hypothetical protein G7077_08075 [Sphingomonas piscis]|uniref:Uncharacterized protein n=1 Tax=Sphingomonas piscis TaxID=2714943 RepID=A0A6G7YQ50_9SPHN|nr:hypothetical protein [Sphingomonas piscis]QIK78857.1 hypothetical protein G7077_08075 [Sphingomonas piscis]